MTDLSHLIIRLNTIGFENKTIDYYYMANSLLNIDLLTINYHDEISFFKDKEEAILKKLTNDYNQYNLLIPPVKIELNKVVIYHNKHLIAPLFLNYQIKKQVISLDELIIDSLNKGKLFWLIKEDNFNCLNPKYNSLFQELDQDYLQSLLNYYTKEDLITILNYLKKQTRYIYLIRLILSNYPNQKLVIPLRDNKDLKLKKSLRLPYKD